MVKKKTKSTKPNRKKAESLVEEDVQVHTGIPPQVEGQLRCFLRLSVNQIVWLIPSPPEITHVRVKWWGEDGDGALFRPLDVKKMDKTVAKTTARYPIRSGPKQFTSYLSDMGSLMLEVLSGLTLTAVGNAEVANIGLISPNRPVNGFFPVMSLNEEKIAELQVSLVLESLMASYDSTGSSIPTTDISMETQPTHESAYPQHLQSIPVPHHQQPRKPQEDPFISPASQQTLAKQSPLNGRSHLRQRLNYDDDRIQNPMTPSRGSSTVSITANGDIVTTDINAQQPSAISPIKGSQLQHYNPNIPSSTNTDVLSVLLNRGNKLREAMIVSSYKEGDENIPLVNLPVTDTSMSVRSSTGSLFKEILNGKAPLSDVDSSMNIRDVSSLNNVDEVTVDLVTDAGLNLKDYQGMPGMYGSPGSSSSAGVYDSSDQGDPLHDQSVLNELFYKRQDSATSGISDMSGDEGKTSRSQSTSVVLEEVANYKPSSRRSSVSSSGLSDSSQKKKRKKSKPKTQTKNKENMTPESPKRKSRSKLRIKGLKKRRRSGSRTSSVSDFSDSDQLSTPRSETSRVSFDMYPSDLEEPVKGKQRKSKKKTDGLSVERLTLLGRVHVGRVTISSLRLKKKDLNRSFSKRKSKYKSVGKPPKPSPGASKPSTYFIEYQFPVLATSRDKYSPNTMATEVMRVASKNIRDGVIIFNHRSVFPVMFNGLAIEKWWKSALMFKIYVRSAGQKMPSLAGSCGVPLKSLLKSDGLCVDKHLEVKGSAKGDANSSLNSSISSDRGGTFGALNVTIELASDSKDFPNALAKTKLAEMTGKAKIVPIPKNSQPPAASLPPRPPEAPFSVKTAPQPRSPSPTKGKDIQNNIHTGNGTDSGYTQSSGSSDCASINLPSNFSRQVNPAQPHHSVYHLPVSTKEHSNSENLMLHTFMLIPEGRNISMDGIQPLQNPLMQPHAVPKPTNLITPGGRDQSVRNTYLVCRMFWSDDAVKSDVCWGTFNPQFNFSEVAPVMIGNALLERLRNNFMIIEVWDKKTTADNDKLIGIVKISLHQFYMSYKDMKITSALLKSQYPVIAIDNYLPVIDPFSGSQFGQIKILLAMGSAEQADMVNLLGKGLSDSKDQSHQSQELQICKLQKLKADVTGNPGNQLLPHRPDHYLERHHIASDSNVHLVQGDGLIVEHIFEIIIDGIRGLQLFENMIWGEADCFVQYHFPAQVTNKQPKQATATMKAFRSATTLCIPDPTFHDATRHRIMLTQGTPVQRELLTACAGSGSGSGGIPFEVWCRYYHPNVRDQVIAKSSLPLAKLCAMVTMQRRGEPSAQTFSLPLTPVSSGTAELDEESKAKMKDSGLMDITIHYKTQTVQSEQTIDLNAAASTTGAAQVCISVSILRASGLKSAAEALARLDSGMQYPSEVGVNAYIKMSFSFMEKENDRQTRTVARSFAPEFSHHFDFPTPLLWTDVMSDAMSLGELLETGEAKFEVWHQVPGLSTDFDQNLLQLEGDIKGRQLVQKTGDVLLGTVKVPLSKLLLQKTGINEWCAIHLPPITWNKHNISMDDNELETTNVSEKIIGGLELSIKFGHHSDREKVLNISRSVGWSPVELDIQEYEWESEEEDCDQYHHININIDQVSFPAHCALHTGQQSMDRSCKCYIRYKFYDKAAVVSRSNKVEINDVGHSTASMKYKHNLLIPPSSPYRWYLQEENLEIQVWLSFTKSEGAQKPKQRDKLIGSAYINLNGLSNIKRKQHRISGLYPLFKAGASSMAGAYLRAHITSKVKAKGVAVDSGDDDLISNGEISESDEDFDPEDSFHHLLNVKKSKNKLSGDNISPSFAVHISIDRAMHLPKISDKNRSKESLPNAYVSFQTTEKSPTKYTPVIDKSENPVWEYEVDAKLTTELLFQENKNLVFKVWHKPSGSTRSPDKSSDRVLGFVSVDLSPLTSGLLQISGWYNIMDFNGQCKGQIKVNIIPQDHVSQYKGGIVSLSSEKISSQHLPFTSQAAVAPSSSFMPSFNTQIPQPLFLPLTSQRFAEHYDNIRRQHEQLQNQLHSISNTQEEEVLNKPVMEQPHSLPAIIPQTYHWKPSLPQVNSDESVSKSMLFSSLRCQLQDLDDITNKLKTRLHTSEAAADNSAFQPYHSVPGGQVPGSIPSNTQSVRLNLTASSQSEFSERNITVQSDTNRVPSARSGRSEELNITHSTLRSTAHSQRPVLSEHNRNINSHISQNESAIDSGLSVENSTEKYHDGADTNRTESSQPTARQISDFSTPRDALLFSGQKDTLTSQYDSQYGTQCDIFPDENNTEIIRGSLDNVNNNHDMLDSDDSESEDEMAGSYHRYREYLDTAQKEEEVCESADEEGDIIVPKRINDVSGIMKKTTVDGFLEKNSEDSGETFPFMPIHGSQTDQISPRFSSIGADHITSSNIDGRPRVNIDSWLSDNEPRESDNQISRLPGASNHQLESRLSGDDEIHTEGYIPEKRIDDIIGHARHLLSNVDFYSTSSIVNTNASLGQTVHQKISENETEQIAFDDECGEIMASPQLQTAYNAERNLNEKHLLSNVDLESAASEMDICNVGSNIDGTKSKDSSNRSNMSSSRSSKTSSTTSNSRPDSGKSDRSAHKSESEKLDEHYSDKSSSRSDSGKSERSVNRSGSEKLYSSHSNKSSSRPDSGKSERSVNRSGSEIIDEAPHNKSSSRPNSGTSDRTNKSGGEMSIQSLSLKSCDVDEFFMGNPTQCYTDNSEKPPKTPRSRTEIIERTNVEEFIIDADSQSDTSNKSASRITSKLPNFFLPASDLEQSMRALKIATAKPPQSAVDGNENKVLDSERQGAMTEAVANMARRLSAPDVAKTKVSAKSRPLPTAEETKRIAKIFSSRFT